MFKSSYLIVKVITLHDLTGIIVKQGQSRVNNLPKGGYYQGIMVVKNSKFMCKLGPIYFTLT